MDGNVVVVAKRNRCLSPLAPLARFRRHAHAAERADDADGPTRRIAVSAADRVVPPLLLVPSLVCSMSRTIRHTAKFFRIIRDVLQVYSKYLSQVQCR